MFVLCPVTTIAYNIHATRARVCVHDKHGVWLPALPVLQEVLTRLPKLSRAELREVEKHCRALASLSGHSDEPADDWLITGIKTELQRRGLIRARFPWKELAPPKFAALCAATSEALLGAFTPPLTSPERFALGRLAGRALADYLERHDGRGHVSAKAMLANIDKVPTALEASFPGYLAAGLLRLCWEEQ
jgi:hypothetical protein